MVNINKDSLPQYRTDYLISWDFSDHDHPYISIMRVEKDATTQQVVGKFIGNSCEKTGVVSLLQAIEHRDYIDRKEEQRREEMPELLRKAFVSRTEK